ncbi:PQQ-binding-like beta-propeller repeat protein [Rubinisphaera sp. JC750]|uniref:outer membrane protein assembly factor BamB family protein n=1 Tax=Rubinisphaera sp. JC750 TaxID=2898658 RepID=UPI001F1EE72C|nr:PQQ-binding-like beta-propeller repeat protein [Rubinisphaera sp. JC750]
MFSALTLTASLFCCLQLATDLETWPGFLGQGSSEVAAETLPLEWTPETLAWTQELPGYGQSSPVIYGDQVFLTAVDGDNKQTLLVFAHQLGNGQQQWSHKATSTFPERSSVYISRAAPTPLVDDNGVYAYFESGDVLALDHQGKPLWAMSLSEKYGHPTNEFGLSASPVQVGEHIIILIDDPAAAYLVAINKKDGSVAWKTDRKPRTSWSSPAVMTIGGQTQVVCSSAGSVDGYNPETGERLWSFDEIGGNTGTTPRPAGLDRFLVAASPGREGENAELARKSNGVMTVKQTANGFQPEFVWTDPSPVPSWASPIEHQGLAYWVNRAGVAYCLNAETGEEVYTERLPQSAWATPVGVGDHIYVFGRDGLTTVLAAGPEFKILAENSLWAEDSPPVNNLPKTEETDERRKAAAAMFSRPVVYGVAIVDGVIVLRTGSKLFCIRGEK